MTIESVTFPDLTSWDKTNQNNLPRTSQKCEWLFPETPEIDPKV